MKLHNDFLGINDSDVILNFLPSDTEEIYKNNLITQGNDWYYKNNTITYSLNRNGHRSKNINEVDLNNYILFTGCSHTFGIGLELEKTYPYIVSKLLDCDYYNLGMPGSGIDVLEYNIMIWLGKVKQKPKLLVVQMPDHTRFCTHNPYIHKDFFIESGSWASDEDEKKMLVNLEDLGFFNFRKYYTYKNIENICDFPILKTNIYGQDNIGYNVKMRRLDYARDLAHSGLKSHHAFSLKLIEIASKMLDINI